MDEKLNLRKVLTGKDGRLLVTIGGKTYSLFEASAFTATLNFTNTDAQPIGSILSGAVPTSVTVTITLTEYYLRDDVMMTPVLEALKQGITPLFDFQGVLDRTMIDGAESRYTFRDCVPDGSVNIDNFTPGEIVTREWSFRGNALPEQIKELIA